MAGLQCTRHWVNSPWHWLSASCAVPPLQHRLPYTSVPFLLVMDVPRGSLTRVSLGEKQCVRAAVLLNALGDNSFSRLFQHIDGAYIPWLVAFFSSSETAMAGQVFLTLNLILTLLPPSPMLKGPL